MSRPRLQPAVADPGDDVTVAVTCVADGRCHAVHDAELAIGATQRSGYYAAVCGHLITPAPMVAPDGEPCPGCTGDNTGRKRRRGFRFRR